MRENVFFRSYSLSPITRLKVVRKHRLATLLLGKGDSGSNYVLSDSRSLKNSHKPLRLVV